MSTLGWACLITANFRDGFESWDFMRLNIPSFSPNYRNSGSLILANSRQDSRIQDLENSPLPRRIGPNAGQPWGCTYSICPSPQVVLTSFGCQGPSILYILVSCTMCFVYQGALHPCSCVPRQTARDSWLKRRWVTPQGRQIADQCALSPATVLNNAQYHSAETHCAWVKIKPPSIPCDPHITGHPRYRWNKIWKCPIRVSAPALVLSENYLFLDLVAIEFQFQLTLRLLKNHPKTPDQAPRVTLKLETSSRPEHCVPSQSLDA